MADTKITALAAITTVDPAADVLPIVDVNDTSMAASGTTKKVTTNQLLGANGIATLASATITGDLTVDTNVLKVDTTNNRVGVNTATPSNPFQIGTTDFIVTTAGNVGIGTATPNVNANRSTLTLQGAWGGQVDINVGAVNHAQFGTDNFSSGLSCRIQSADGIIFKVNGSTDGMRLTASGNLGIGVTPSAWGAAYKSIQQQFGGSVFTSNAGSIGLSGNCYNNGTNWIYSSGNPATRYEIGPDGGNHRWFIAGSGTAGNAITFTQAMTLDASGNLLVGTITTAGAGHTFYQSGLYDSVRTGTTSQDHIKFSNGNGVVGAIGTNGSNTFYNTSSDYRLKESVQPIVGGLSRVNALKPSIYKWKADGSGGEGFLAHELAEVVPLAVTGEKDAVNEDGSIKTQGVDLSKVVPILVAAIQELTARVQTLEAK